MFRKLIVFIFAAFIGGLIGASIIYYYSPKPETRNLKPETSPVSFTNYPISASSRNLTVEQVDFVTAAEISTPAVVHIQTLTNAPDYNNNPVPDYYRDYFRFFNPPSNPKIGSGSGVIISSDGYIVSNNHVIEEADEIKVILNDKKTYIGKVIGKDPNTDLALIKIDEKNLPFIKFADSDKVKIGEWVLAVGNPFNLTSTVTAGIISARGRNINIFNRGMYPYAVESFLQTDAAINPGNSGGALVNIGGELIGINTAIASQTGSYAGYGFAIPSNLAKKVVDDLIKYGLVQRAFIGISMQTVDDEVAKNNGLKDIKGVFVASVLENGAAESAGIKEGDIVLAINNIEVNSTSDLQEQIVKFCPGEKVKINIFRKNKSMIFDVTLRNLQGDTKLVEKEIENIFSFMNTEFSTLTTEEKNKMGLKYGIKINKINMGSIFKEIGVEPGYVITAIDNKPISTLQDIKYSLATKKGGILIEGYYARGRKVFYGIELK